MDGAAAGGAIVTAGVVATGSGAGVVEAQADRARAETSAAALSDIREDRRRIT